MVESGWYYNKKSKPDAEGFKFVLKNLTYWVSLKSKNLKVLNSQKQRMPTTECWYRSTEAWNGDYQKCRWGKYENTWVKSKQVEVHMIKFESVIY